MSRFFFFLMILVASVATTGCKVIDDDRKVIVTNPYGDEWTTVDAHAPTNMDLLFAEKKAEVYLGKVVQVQAIGGGLERGCIDINPNYRRPCGVAPVGTLVVGKKMHLRQIRILRFAPQEGQEIDTQDTDGFFLSEKEVVALGPLANIRQ